MAVDSETRQFVGDYFGQLQEEDFNWEESQNRDVDEGHDDDELDDDEDNINPGLYEDLGESPSPSVLHSEAHSHSNTHARPSLLGPPAPALHQSNPEHVKHFPGLAGASLPGLRNTIYTTYWRDIHNKPIIWDPFNSQTNWEFARWAKLRGPSSTAISDLLEIDGVSNSIDLIIKVANYCISYTRNLGFRIRIWEGSTR